MLRLWASFIVGSATMPGVQLAASLRSDLLYLRQHCRLQRESGMVCRTSKIWARAVCSGCSSRHAVAVPGVRCHVAITAPAREQDARFPAARDVPGVWTAESAQRVAAVRQVLSWYF